MAPAALFNPSFTMTPPTDGSLHSTSGGSASPVHSPGYSTPVMLEDCDGFSFQSAASSRCPSQQQTHQQPIAIVGMACRLPGGAHSPAEFWELCSRARSGFLSGVPKERFRHEAFYHPNPGKPGAYHSQGGYFLAEDPALFDAPFFSLTEKEAIAMDPQQRLLLECTFEALENAGIPKQSAVGRNIGVFIGGSLSEYETHMSRDSDSMPMHQSTGTAHAMQSNRLSHFFDFRGPSVTLDTACSASLVALHVACQSIRNGEAEVAITGSCHLNMLPDSFISFSTGRLLSDSGRSIAFDERGSGFGRGEGCGVLVLKPLNRAIADKDSIRAVIRGTGINQDGRTAGITMPNGEAQENLIHQVYRAAGLDPRDCGFVEAHGTGTKIGDPTEAGAIYRALGRDRSSKDPLYIGSVKSNIGHLEAASGIAAVIKAALSLERGFILPNHDFKKPNSRIPWKEWNLAVPKTQRPWPKGKKYISVNNFGFGGTNAHVVLERAPFSARNPSMARRASSLGGSIHVQNHKRLFLLSGNDRQSLETVMANLVVYLEQRPEIFQSDLLENLAHTLARRSLLKWRVAIPATTSFELIEALNSNGMLPSKASVSGQGPTAELRLGFVFTGQGAQWHAMGRELYGLHGFQVYTAALNRADRQLGKLGAEWSLVEELVHKTAERSRVSEAAVSQPACTAVQLCLVDLLRFWGIRPAAVTGHSSGEIAAAYAAGFLTFKSAMAVAYHRGRMFPILKASYPRLQGTMMAVGGSKEEIQKILDGVNATPALQRQGFQVRIACYNSPSSFTISGDSVGITLLESVLRVHHPDTFNRRLQVDVAYHSHHMNLIAKEYKECLRTLDHPKSVAGTRFYSSLHGRQVDGAECDAAYWVDNLTRPVRFSEALTRMVTPRPEEEASVGMLVELGPHAALQGPIQQILQAAGVGRDVAYSSALVRKRSAIDSALDLAAIVVAKGGQVHVDAVNSPSGISNLKVSLLTDLPRYAWNHQKRYWHEARLSQMHHHRGTHGARNELIGLEAMYSTPLEPTWRNVFFLDDLPWLRHHQIQGLVVFPLAGFVTMAVEAASQRARSQASRSRQSTADVAAVELRDVQVLTPLAFPPDVVEGNSSIELSISLRRRRHAAPGEDWAEFHICSWSAGQEWTEHCVGLVMARAHDSRMTARHAALLRNASSAAEGVDAVAMGVAETSAMYAELAGKLGVDYGPSFQAIWECNTAGRFAAGNISTSVDSDMAFRGSSALHPAVLESVIDMYWPILRAEDAQDTVYLPSSIRHMYIATGAATACRPVGPDLKAFCSAAFGKSQPRPTSVDMLATSASPGSDPANVVVAIEGLVVSPLLDMDALPSLEDSHRPREVCYKLAWEPLEAAHAPGPGQPSVGQQPAPDRPLPDTEFVLVYSETGSPSHLLASQLEATLASATEKVPEMEEGVFNRGLAGSPEALEPLVAGKTCIVLTEIDQAFLADADENQFETLKKLATVADRILWITRGAYLDSQQPSANMISGLSRSVRSETNKPFAHLDLEGTSGRSQEPEKISAVILEVLGAAFGSAKTGDMEFSSRSNLLLVPRVVGDAQMDLAVQRDTHPRLLELQPYGQASAHGRALRMQFEAAHLPLRGVAGPATIREVSFVEDALSAAEADLQDDEIEFAVQAVGVTAHDALAAAAGAADTGLEAAGVVTRVGGAVVDPHLQVGCAVAGLTSAMKRAGSPGAYASRARTSAAVALPLHAPRPGRAAGPIAFADAAALPLAYTTASYALVDEARLEAGQRVLVTCPSGTVAQAAVCLALEQDAAVYLLASSAEEKARAVARHAGAIPADRVLASHGSSSSTHWDARETHDALRHATSGNGFDVILDLHHGTPEKSHHLRPMLCACLAPFGRLVHVHEPSLSGDQGGSSDLPLHGLPSSPSSTFADGLQPSSNASYMAVDMLALARGRPQVLARVFARVAALFRDGKLAPLHDVAVLPFSQAHTALNSLHTAEARSRKTVLAHTADDPVLAPPHHGTAAARLLHGDATYVIVGGTGGLGRSMAKWMAANGARHVVLLSRHASATPAVQVLTDEAAAVGAQIHVRRCDVANAASVASLLGWMAAEAQLPPVRGVLHSAMVLRDVLFEKMSHADYRAVIASKVQGAWNLHRALDGADADGGGGGGSSSSSSSSSRHRLDFFIAISSVAAIVGNRGQAAYAAANSYLDALVQHRRASGLPAVALALGAVSDAGYLADPARGAARAADILRNLGGGASSSSNNSSNNNNNTLCEAEVLALLRAAVAGVTASCRDHVITGAAVQGGRRPAPFWADDAKFGRIRGGGGGGGDDDAACSEASGGERSATATALHPGLAAAEAEAVVCRGLVAKIAGVLMMEPEELDVARSLSHYPLDSLVAIDVRNFIARQYEASLQVLELLSSGSILALSTIVCRKSKLRRAAPQ